MCNCQSAFEPSKIPIFNIFLATLATRNLIFRSYESWDFVWSQISRYWGRQVDQLTKDTG